MTLKASDNCLGVVLAGGLSSRMGQDKAKLKHVNGTMLEFSKQTLADSGVDSVIVSGDDYDVPDNIQQSGPVAGILSVLARFPEIKSLLIVPVDLPFMTAKALTDLRVKGELSQKATYFSGHHIPLYLPNNAYLALFLSQAFTGKTNTQASHARFATKGPSFKGLLKQIPHQAIQINDTNTLFNTNTPNEWQQAKKLFTL